MPTIKDWSTTANLNDQSLTGIDWDENMLPSQVNNSARDTLAQIAQFVKDVYAGITQYYDDTGAANAYVITPAPAIAAYAAGQSFAFKAVNANAAASTLNVNGLGVKSILRYDGTALAGGDIPAGGIVVVIYDGTNFRAVSPLGNAVKDANNTFSGANTFSGNNTFSGANTFTGDTEFDDADAIVSITSPTTTTESAGIGIFNKKTFFYRTTSQETFTRQWFKFTLPDIVDIIAMVRVEAVIQMPGTISSGMCVGWYRIQQKQAGGTPEADPALILNHGFGSLSSPVASGNDVIFGGHIKNNGTEQFGTIDLYITLYSDDPSNFTFTGLPGTVDHTGLTFTTSVVAGDRVVPRTHNEHDLGTSSYRWRDIFSVNAVSVSSDARMKQQVEAIPDAVLDAWEAVQYRQFKFNSAVDENGDRAPRHTGVIAQDIDGAFAAAGLDAKDYGLFVQDTSESEDAPLGIRPTECLMLEAASLRRKTRALEDKMATLDRLITARS